MVSSRVDVFLNNFHYLNKKGSRSGCLMFGSNKPLTAELESLARKLHADLSALKANDALGVGAADNQFLATIRTCFNAVEATRIKHGKAFEPRKNKPFNMHDDTRTWQSQWVKPYQPGRFEKQIVTALTAVDESIDEVELKAAGLNPNGRAYLESFKQNCRNLALEIGHYKQPKNAIAEIQDSKARRPKH